MWNGGGSPPRSPPVAQPGVCRRAIPCSFFQPAIRAAMSGRIAGSAIVPADRRPAPWRPHRVRSTVRKGSIGATAAWMSPVAGCPKTGSQRKKEAYGSTHRQDLRFGARPGSSLRATVPRPPRRLQSSLSPQRDSPHHSRVAPHAAMCRTRRFVRREAAPAHRHRAVRPGVPVENRRALALPSPSTAGLLLGNSPLRSPCSSLPPTRR